MQDPVCGMTVTPRQAVALSVYAGRTYAFCARTCKERFDTEPERYVQPTEHLPEHARRLYDALSTLSKVFYGPTTQRGMGRDLTEAERDVIHLLGERGECRMRELAAESAVPLSTMTGIVDRLVKKGLLQRRHSATDRRVVLAQLSAPGQLAYQERLDADMRLVLGMLQALSTAEQPTLVALMDKIVRALPAEL